MIDNKLLTSFIIRSNIFVIARKEIAGMKSMFNVK